MSNFKSLLEDILLEQNKSFADLEKAGIIYERAFYQYKDYTPYLTTILSIANYLEVSLDYLAGRTNDNVFHVYKIPPTGISDRIFAELRAKGKNKSQFEHDTKVSRSNFSYWKRGTLPKFQTLITIANYFNCSIDIFLEQE